MTTINHSKESQDIHSMSNHLQGLLPAEYFAGEYFKKLSVPFSQIQSEHYASIEKLLPQPPQFKALQEQMETISRQWANKSTQITQAALSSPQVQSSLTSAYSQAAESLQRISFPTNQQFIALDATIADLLKRIRSAKSGVEPKVINKANLPEYIKTTIDSIGLQSLLSLIENNPIGIYAISDPKIIISLCEAKTDLEKNKILENNQNDIISGCKNLISTQKRNNSKTLREFTLSAIDTMLDGHDIAAQALLTNILDTTIATYIPAHAKKSRKKIIVHEKENADYQKCETIQSTDLINILVWGPICVGHLTYQRDNGDQPLNDYNRHVSVHSVGIIQYSKANCLKVLTLVASLFNYGENRTISEIVNAVDRL